MKIQCLTLANGEDIIAYTIFDREKRNKIADQYKSDFIVPMVRVIFPLKIVQELRFNPPQVRVHLFDWKIFGVAKEYKFPDTFVMIHDDPLESFQEQYLHELEVRKLSRAHFEAQEKKRMAQAPDLGKFKMPTKNIQ